MPPVSLGQVAVHLRPEDNIAVASQNLAADLEIQVNGSLLKLAKRIGMGHKIAVRPIKKGTAVTKYGQIIGFAMEDIAPGELVHVHNVSADNFERDYAFCRDRVPTPKATQLDDFMGYDRGLERSDPFRYGTRNYIAIISTVNCSASTSKYVSEKFRAAAC